MAALEAGPARSAIRVRGLPLPRTLTAIPVLLLALIAWGCSGSNDADQPAAALVASDFQVASANFTEIRPKVRIPEKNTCYGGNLSPPLTWAGGPEGTQSYALIVEDIDHLSGAWAHWVLYNIPPTATELAEAVPTTTDRLPDGTVQGSNDFKNVGYEGPCPIGVTLNYNNDFEKTFGEAAHKDVFTLYALDTEVSLSPGASKDQLLAAMDSHILGRTDTVGKFQVANTTESKKDFNRTLYIDTPTPTAP